MKLFIKCIFSILFTLSLYGQDPHLMLYFDMNKTLIASDQLQGKSEEDILNEILASQWKSCWDTTIQEPITYIEYVKQVVVPGPANDPELHQKRQFHYHHFIDDLQERNHPLYQEIATIYHQALDKLYSSPSLVFPSFYQLLNKLEAEQRSYTIILRSFGSEVFEIADKINTTFKPLFHHYGNFKQGTLTVDDQQQGSNLSEVYQMLHSLSHMAIRDDYDYWDQGEFRTPFGKPFLLNQSNNDVLEIFFDDHINLNTQETNIIAPIDIQTGQTIPTEKLVRSGQVVRVNTLEAILNDDYFIKHVQRALTTREQQPYHVGELGKSWEFPSDHLPIGASVDNIHMMCWNILDKDYLGYIELNTQGLKHSAILRDDVTVSQDSPLTVREKIIAEHILEMVQHPTHPRSLIALQETHHDVLNFLKARLPSSWVVLTADNQSKPEDVFLYDSNLFELVDLNAINYSLKVSNIIFTVDLREKSSGKIYRFVQSHIPGGPNSPAACAEFAREALNQYEENLTIILMGDMNQPPSVIEQALRQTASDLKMEQPYQHLSINSPTHVNTHLEASWIDNLFVFSPEGKESVQVSQDAEEFFPALLPIIDLFDQLRPR